MARGARMHDLPRAEQFLATVTNGAQHDQSFWFDPDNLLAASHWCPDPGRWGLLLGNVAKQLGPAFVAAWRRAVQQRAQQSDRAPAFAVPQAARDLLAQQFPPLRMLVQGLLAEGLTILAGKPKKGKSYLA